jgi:hypothetical protein
VETSNNLTLCDLTTVTNPRIRQLMELSINQTPFDNRYYHQLEIMDEYALLQTEVCGQVPILHQRMSEFQARKSEYILTYADGQLIEVIDLKIERVVFRNFSSKFQNFYQSVPKLDPLLKLPQKKGGNRIRLRLLIKVVEAPHTAEDPSIYLINDFDEPDYQPYTRYHKSRYLLSEESVYCNRRVPVYVDWLQKVSIKGNYKLDCFKAKADLSKLLVLLNSYGIKFYYIR